MRRHLAGLLILTWTLGHLSPAQAAPTITSPPPANGVSPSAPLVFTFSEAMNTNVTEVTFFRLSPPFDSLPTTMAWSGGNTVLTCTPSPAPFPASTSIAWNATGENLAGDSLGDPTSGFFTTGTGGGGGYGTNATTTFSVGKVYHYNQTSSGAPTLDPGTPYGFSGVTMLASNRTATSITLTLPTASVSNMTQLPSQPEIYVVYGVDTSLSNYDATFPSGTYSFFVQAASSNQTVMVTLPVTNIQSQPGAPHLTNFPATQAVNPGQDFVLGWDAFPGGTAADYIDVDIGTNYGSPNPGLPGALTGTARTFTVPAGTLQPNASYSSRVGFFHYAGITNAGYVTAAYRATYTEFTLITAGASPLILTNATFTSGVFSFDVLCTNGQTVTVEYANALPAVNWTNLLTTNSAGTQFHVVSPQAASNASLFYRARNGP